MEKIKTLLLHYTDTDKLSYMDDWFDAFKKDSRFIIHDINLCKKKDYKEINKEYFNVDLIVLLHSVLKSHDSIAVGINFKEIFINRKCKLLAFVADEVNIHITPLSLKLNFLSQIDPDYIATQLPIDAGKWLYEDIRSAKVIPLPHALNPEIFKPEKSRYERKVDIGMISVPYPVYLGDNERNEILNFFSTNANKYGLKVNIVKAKTKSQRLDRIGWAKFLNDCKGTVSSEAGSYYLEKNDKTVFAIMEYLLKKLDRKKVVTNKSKLWEIWNLIPYNIREFIKIYLFIKESTLSKQFRKFIDWDGYISYDENLYEEIYNIFYKNLNPNPIYTKAISSRHFEAIGTKTLQILFRGKYNDILLPNEHYIPLEKDFSNIETVIEKFKDEKYSKIIIEQAYVHVLENHTYKCRIDKIYNLIRG